MFLLTKTNRVEITLTLIHQNKYDFDVVVSDVHMRDMDGFKLLEHIRLKWTFLLLVSIDK